MRQAGRQAERRFQLQRRLRLLPPARHKSRSSPRPKPRRPAKPAPANKDQAKLVEKAKLQRHFGRFDILFFLITNAAGDHIFQVMNFGFFGRQYPGANLFIDQ